MGQKTLHIDDPNLGLLKQALYLVHKRARLLPDPLKVTAEIDKTGGGDHLVEHGEVHVELGLEELNLEFGHLLLILILGQFTLKIAALEVLNFPLFLGHGLALGLHLGQEHLDEQALCVHVGYLKTRPLGERCELVFQG